MKSCQGTFCHRTPGDVRPPLEKLLARILWRILQFEKVLILGSLFAKRAVATVKIGK
jgi:hypothetical protein